MAVGKHKSLFVAPHIFYLTCPSVREEGNEVAIVLCAVLSVGSYSVQSTLADALNSLGGVIRVACRVGIDVASLDSMSKFSCPSNNKKKNG